MMVVTSAGVKGGNRTKARFSVLVRLALMVAGLVMAGWLAANAAVWLYNTISLTADWSRTVKISRSGLKVADLFRELVNRGLVFYDPKTALVAVRSCDYEQKRRLLVGKNITATEEQDFGLMRQLCSTGRGRAILEQVEIWNGSFSILALRDDRPDSLLSAAGRKRQQATAASDDSSDDKCAVRAAVRNVSTAAPNILPKGCRQPEWHAEFRAGTGADAVLVDANAEQINEDPAPKLYGFFAERALRTVLSQAQRGGVRPFGDWYRLKVLPGSESDVSGGQAAVYHLSTVLGPSRRAEAVRVEVIGEVLDVIINGRSRKELLRSKQACKRLFFDQVGRRRFTRIFNCDHKLDAADKVTPRGVELIIPVRGLNQPTRLTIVVRPIRGLPEKLRAFGDAVFKGFPRAQVRQEGAAQSDDDVVVITPGSPDQEGKSADEVVDNTDDDEAGQQDSQTAVTPGETVEVFDQETPETAGQEPSENITLAPTAAERAVVKTEAELKRTTVFQFDSKIRVICGQQRQRPTSGIAARSRLKSQAIKQCFLAWAGSGRPQRVFTPKLQILARDGTPLTNETGELNKLAFAAGLAPITGLSARDDFALVGQVLPQLKTADQALKLRLTIDLQAQQIANWVLDSITRRVACQKTKIVRARRKRGKRRKVVVQAGVPRALCLEYIYKLVCPRGFKVCRNRTLDALRRASVVILDAGAGNDSQPGFTQPGAILAAATWPNLPEGLNEWDVTGNNIWDPQASPLAARAWSQSDRFMVPGSTFKVITGLAALQAIADGERFDAPPDARDRAIRLRRAVEGVSRAEIREVLGIGWEARFMPYERGRKGTLTGDEQNGPGLRDFHKVGLGPKITKNNLSFCRSSVGGDRGSVEIAGLCEAVKRSSNMWFARLAMITDQDNLAEGERELKRDSGNYHLSQMARRVMPSARAYNLIAPFNARRGSRVCLDRPYLESEFGSRFGRGIARWIALAQNAIGQSSQVTPLAMAAALASVGSGQIVRPRLIASSSDEILPFINLEAADKPARFCQDDRSEPAKAGEPVIKGLTDERGRIDLVTQDRLLEPLRRGLKAVVVGLSGTAFTAFHPKNRAIGNKAYRELVAQIAPFVAGKTGTATNKKSEPNSAWFVGYVEPIAGSGIRRRLAFACSVTLTQKGGGAVCAPIIARILACLHSPKSDFCPQFNVPKPS